MNKLATATLLFLSLIALNACQQNDNESTTENNKQSESEALKALKVKLNATEAQLLNIQVELAKCKGDSLAMDSLANND